MQENATGLSEQNYGNVYNRAYGAFNDTQNRNAGLAGQAYGQFADTQNRNIGLAGQDYGQFADTQNRRMNLAGQDYGRFNDTMNRNVGLAGQDYARFADTRANNLGLYDRAYGNYRDTQGFNLNLAGMGQSAAAGQAAAGLNYGNQAGGLLTDQGNANAAGRVGSANAWSGAMGNIANNLTLQEMLRRGY